MRILGIDPGSRITGFGVVQVARAGTLAYIASGCIRVPAGDLAARLKSIHDGIAEIVAAYNPTACAIEKVFLARNPDSALKLGQARGVALVAAIDRGLPIAEYTALQIKRAVVGRGHADKTQVQHMVRTLLKLDGTPAADAADALACAICHAHHAGGRAAFAHGVARRRTALIGIGAR